MRIEKTKYRVLCTDLLVPMKVLEQRLGEIALIDLDELDYLSLKQSIGNYDVYFAGAHIKADRSVLEKAKRLKIIATASTGTDHIDVEYAIQKKIEILHLAKEYELLDNFSATAEMAWCLLLALLRKLPQAFESANQGIWARQKYAGTQLLEKTIGILGFGRLGKMMADIAFGFRMNVIGCDIRPIDNLKVIQVDFNTLLAQSDILSIHVHLNSETRGMISREAISRMKKGVIIINTSRGAIIDEEAFLEALTAGHIGGAGLDVIQGEWDKGLVNHPLIKYSREHGNLIITPHIGGSTIESIVGAREFMARKLGARLKSGIGNGTIGSSL